jgi:hypothetical protein
MPGFEALTPISVCFGLSRFLRGPFNSTLPKPDDLFFAVSTCLHDVRLSGQGITHCLRSGFVAGHFILINSLRVGEKEFIKNVIRERSKHFTSGDFALKVLCSVAAVL